MRVLLLVSSVLALVAAIPEEAPVRLEDGYRHLPVYGAPLVGVRYGDQPSDGLVTQEALGWRSLYDAPFILVVQQDAKPELAGFLIKEGLRSLPFIEDRRFLLNLLLTGPEKVGLLLSASNFVALPHVDMPITRFVLPHHFSLAESARLHADFYSFPTLLLVNREDVGPRDMARLSLVGDFTVLPDSIKVSSDVPAPAAKWGRRATTAYSVVNGVNSAPKAAYFAPLNSGLDVSLAQNPYMHNPFLAKFSTIH